ncbi:MAG TPA: helix-turn-helix domain-containing protein [Bacteroidales bacterium]|nr:helix-turn-helix domain-containing protein [Bacteroidales bacterium]
MKNKERLIRKMKNAVEDLQPYSYEEFREKLPALVDRSYSFGLLDTIFTKRTGKSLKDYFNQRKLEKASELIEQYHLTALEVAYQLGFKSISAMIKTITDLHRSISTDIIANLQRQFGSMLPAM